MALNAPRLAVALVSAHVSAGAAPGPELTTLCSAVAAAIVAEITANAVVPGTGLVAPAGGGPVTGAGQVQ